MKQAKTAGSLERETIDSESPEQTIALAKRVAAARPECSAFYLDGDLGAGKTVFAKGIASFHGIEESAVVSPTFALVNRYGGGRRTLYHIDLYRIENQKELEELGIEDMEEEGALLVVEWPEKLGRYIRSDAVLVHIEVTSEAHRRITVAPVGATGFPRRSETTAS
jgi:tRNA threonylcarbamoyladenosine biosynthesis protein TsaE